MKAARVRGVRRNREDRATRPPMVSVVVIFWNAEPFIGEAVESVFAQTYRDWELLLVDDGSSDGSTEVALEHARLRPEKVQYLVHEGRRNRGMSASRNLAIAHAKGRFVALLDADDVWLPDKLEQQVALLTRQPEAAMVYGPTQWWYSWTGRPEDAARDYVHELGLPPNTLIPPPTLLTRLVADEGISPCTCSMLIRREALQRVGGFEESFLGLYEDQVLCAKLCLESPVFAAGQCSYRYRQHPNSAVSVAQRTGTAPAARSMFLEWLSAYVADRGVADAELWDAIDRERSRAEHVIHGGRWRPGSRARSVWDMVRGAAVRARGRVEDDT